MQQGGTILKVIVGIIIVAILAALGFVAWRVLSNASGPASNTFTENAEGDDLVRQPPSLEQVLSNPEAYYGQRIAVSGEIQDIYSPRIFTISNQPAGDELLVITQAPLTERQAEGSEKLLNDNANVQVIGALRQLSVEEIESRYRLSIPVDVANSFDQRPALIASRINFLDFGPEFYEFLEPEPVNMEAR